MKLKSTSSTRPQRIQASEKVVNQISLDPCLAGSYYRVAVKELLHEVMTAKTSFCFASLLLYLQVSSLAATQLSGCARIMPAMLQVLRKSQPGRLRGIAVDVLQFNTRCHGLSRSNVYPPAIDMEAHGGPQVQHGALIRESVPLSLPCELGQGRVSSAERPNEGSSISALNAGAEIVTDLFECLSEVYDTLAALGICDHRVLVLIQAPTVTYYASYFVSEPLN